MTSASGPMATEPSSSTTINDIGAYSAIMELDSILPTDRTDILYVIESKIRDRRRHSTQLLGLSKYSLEHIMPKKWRSHWTFTGAKRLRISATANCLRWEI